MKYGPAFYGVEVYLEPAALGYAVMARVHIGRFGGYIRECGKLGEVKTDAEAVARWSEIESREDGLRIGSGEGAFFLSKAVLENHR